LHRKVASSCCEVVTTDVKLLTAATKLSIDARRLYYAGVKLPNADVKLLEVVNHYYEVVCNIKIYYGKLGNNKKQLVKQSDYKGPGLRV
jgi:hypothetical protein